MSAPMYLCLHLHDFAAQTLVRLEPELRKRPVAILDGDPPLETVFALNQRARILGLESGMSRLQAESFEGVAVSGRVKQQEDSAFLIFMKSAERFSPRIEVLASPTESTSGAALILDASGSERLFGAPGQPDPLGHMAGSRAGAMSVLIGIAANDSIARGQPVAIEDLL